MQTFYPGFNSKKMTQKKLIMKQTDRKCTEKEEEGHMEKKVTEKLCPAHFARDRDNIISANARRTGLGVIYGNTKRDSTNRPVAFTSRHLKDARKNNWMGEPKL